MKVPDAAVAEDRKPWEANSAKAILPGYTTRQLDLYFNTSKRKLLWMCVKQPLDFICFSGSWLATDLRNWGHNQMQLKKIPY